MTPADVPNPWLRGALDLCLLTLLYDGEAYGYGEVQGSSLYPALLRLERAGLLEARWRPGDGGPGRKYYGLTASGRAELTALATSWRRFTGAVAGLLDEVVPA